MSILKTTYFWAVILVILNGLLLSSIIPPFQSPDEFEHVRRAYLLTQGEILLDTPHGMKNSGGMIDTGLLDFEKSYRHLPTHADVKLTSSEIAESKKIVWSREKIFASVSGAAYYFPLIYLPQATGLWVGEKLDLTLANSYLLARYAAFLFVGVVLFLAFRLYPVNPLLLAFLFIPMTLFQCASASLDGVSTALSILSISAFLAFMQTKKVESNRLFYICLISISLVVMTRIHLIPLLVLPFVMALYSKSKVKFIFSLLGLCGVGAWIFLAYTKTTHAYIQVEIGAGSMDVVIYHVLHPWVYFQLLFYSMQQHLLEYGATFIGVLGWQDTFLSHLSYFILFILLMLVACFSISLKTLDPSKVARGVLALTSLLSILLLFFILLVMWNPHPTKIIDGIQGRYFLVPAMMLAYAICGLPADARGYRRWAIAFWLVLLLEGVSLFSTAQALIGRYYHTDVVL